MLMFSNRKVTLKITRWNRFFLGSVIRIIIVGWEKILFPTGFEPVTLQLIVL